MGKWIRDEQTVVWSYNGVLLSNKKEQSTNTCNDMDDSQKHQTEEKKSYIKEFILYDFIYMKFYNWQY